MNILVVTTGANISNDNKIKEELFCNTDLSIDYVEIKELIKMKKYDIIIIDLTEYTGVRIFGLLTKLTPRQKIITIGTDSSCSVTLGCDFCLDTYNKKRLVRPYTTKQLEELINNFDSTTCQYQH
ncbi:MAG: hypothetical protein OIF32_01680 [Campylobacterales bacterium]|nr:hypothetical protein [Campylobacterales bacterium]